jgi:hypothetical protein
LRQARQLLGLRRRAALQELVAEPELTGDQRAGTPRDNVRADLCQAPFGEFRMAVVQVPGDGQLENAVAEEFEPFVRRGAVRRPGRVGEDVL